MGAGDVLSGRDEAEDRVNTQPRKKKTPEDAKIELYGNPQAGDGTLARQASIQTMARMREILAKRGQ